MSHLLLLLEVNLPIEFIRDPLFLIAFEIFETVQIELNVQIGLKSRLMDNFISSRLAHQYKFRIALCKFKEKSFLKKFELLLPCLYLSFSCWSYSGASFLVDCYFLPPHESHSDEKKSEKFYILCY